MGARNCHAPIGLTKALSRLDEWAERIERSVLSFLSLVKNSVPPTISRSLTAIMIASSNSLHRGSGMPNHDIGDSVLSPRQDAAAILAFSDTTPRMPNR